MFIGEPNLSYRYDATRKMEIHPTMLVIQRAKRHQFQSTFRVVLFIMH